MIYTDEHTSQYFSNSYTIARANWYGVSGVPDVYFSGTAEVLGAGSCTSAHAQYLPILQDQLAANDGMSPVGITGTCTINGLTATLTARFILTEPAALQNVRASFFLYEDHIFYNNAYWDKMCRVILYEPVTTLVNVGDEATVVKTVNLDASWNQSQLHAAVVLEAASNPKGVVQASFLPPRHALDYSVSLPARVASVPAGNGEVTFSGSIWNLGASGDQMTLAVDQAIGWPTDFQIAGDPNWYTSHVVPLAANESKAFTIRVRTDGTRRIGTGGFTAVSANTGRQQPLSFRVFNGSPAVLFVDDDNGSGYGGVDFDIIYRTTLDQNNYLYEWWDAKNSHGNVCPSASYMRGFDVVVWQTAWQSSTVLTDGDIAALESYLDEGGKLYLNSCTFLTTATAGAFTTDYLGLASWTNNTQASTEYGVGGDPISDGMVLPLTWPVPQANQTDTVNPTSTAAAFFFSEGNEPNALRNTISPTSRVVFSTVPHNCFSQTAPDPNNAKVVMGKIMTWLIGSDPTSAPQGPLAGRVELLNARPNPFSPQTELTFRVTETAPVRLTLVDATGRLVRSLVSGALTPGQHSIVWDGTDGAGNRVASGTYFARLESGGRPLATKLVLLQ